jgi:glycosyltransferase involved in cell wall biosynthesis
VQRLCSVSVCDVVGSGDICGPTERSGVSADACYLAVVPAYNEAASVSQVIGALHERAPEFDVVVVDDGSTDDTAQQARHAGARVLRLPFNLGIGGAVQAGFQFAAEQGYDFMAQVDGDGQHEPSELSKLVAEMNGPDRPDMVCGSRFLTEDHHYPAPLSRRTGIHIFAALLSVIVSRQVSDPTSGFRLYNRRAIELFARDYPHDYPEVEAVLMLHHHRLRMRETPVRMYTRDSGVSSISSGKSAYYMVKVMLALMVGLARKRPVVDPGDQAPVTAKDGV